MIDLGKSWELAQNNLKEKLGETVFSTWIAPLRFSVSEDSGISLEAPDQFFKDWVDKHYLGLIDAEIKKGGLNNLLIKLTVGAPRTMPAVVADATDQQAKASFVQGFVNLNPRYTFENFVIGHSNRHAHAYSLAVANLPAKTYNPLFIYGGVGLGKTHLIQAICHQIKNNA